MGQWKKGDPTQAIDFNEYQNCPVCESDEFEGGPFDVDGSEVYQEMTCQNCEATWQDVYTMQSRVTIEEGMQPMAHTEQWMIGATLTFDVRSKDGIVAVIENATILPYQGDFVLNAALDKDGKFIAGYESALQSSDINTFLYDYLQANRVSQPNDPKGLYTKYALKWEG